MPIPPEREEEISRLAASYGEPRRVIADMTCQELFDPLFKTDRIGEVCMVVRRPTGRIITARKTFYPPNGYRLLTGGISHGEGIEEALLRETFEETSLDVVVRQFLAVIEHRIQPKHPEDAPIKEFFTFAFLLDETGGTLHPHDDSEKIAGFREILPGELPAMAHTLESLSLEDDPDSEFGEALHYWGTFRAIAHKVVFDTMMSARSCTRCSL
jgi:8-oxo-dGTP pyrophosphatase MutT (NUDIX family)